MKNLIVISLLIVIGVSTVGFALTTWQSTTKSDKPESQYHESEAAQSPLPARAPEHIVYRQFFRHLLALKERATELERQGKNGNGLRSHYKDKIKLKDKDARALDQIASDCEREIAQIDARAKAIIQSARARFPNGKLPPGQQLPPPPPELKRMQLQRNVLIMQARERLRTAIGRDEFQKINDYIKLNFAPNVQPAQINMQ